MLAIFADQETKFIKIACGPNVSRSPLSSNLKLTSRQNLLNVDTTQ